MNQIDWNHLISDKYPTPKDLIMDLFEKHKAFVRVAKKLGIGESTLYRYCKAHGIDTSKRHFPKMDSVMRVQGLDTKKDSVIAKEAGCTQAWVCILRKRGVI